jgi:long-subunit fatty acid transport protein
MLNAWGGDPGFTSSIFSRNEYRENVTAFKIGGRYKITPKLTLKGGYANYGQSDTSAPAKVLKVAATGRVAPQTDATELDIALIWKPKKNVMLKLFHANRTSEYEGANSKDLTQAHTRLIGVYKF